MNPVIGFFIIFLIISFFWVLLSVIMNRILNILVDETEDKESIDEGIVMIGSVFSPISAVGVSVIYTVKLFIFISNFIIDGVIRTANKTIEKLKEFENFKVKW